MMNICLINFIFMTQGKKKHHYSLLKIWGLHAMLSPIYSQIITLYEVYLTKGVLSAFLIKVSNPLLFLS